MNHDPHYQRIVDGLACLSDGILFERCVCDLLREEWPTLVPVSGGKDAGLDGAWGADGFVVATIGSDVIGNVTQNLKSRQDKRGNRSRVLVVTSQQLSPASCQRIEDRVKELGFSLASHVYTREAIADRLYHNSHWCVALGIPALLSTLSKIPRTVRQLRQLPLIGRSSDLEWLESCEGDRLVVGQPGIGKTFLAQTFVSDGHGLFATSDDANLLGAAIRDQKPTSVIVEDAHLRRTTIDDLIRIRTESGIRFDIIADCWPAARSEMQTALNAPDVRCRELKPLRRHEIVELLRAAGVSGPEALIHQIVQQSMGCPGRAALLASFCLSGGITEVWKGETLSKWVESTFSRLVGDDVSAILAGFAIGGRRGMQLDDVAAFLEIPSSTVRERITKLAAGGVVQEVGGSAIAVFPHSVRSILVRDHFFNSIAPPPFKQLLSRAIEFGSAIETLVLAKILGARIPTSEILALLEQTQSHGAWATFVWNDKRHAELLIDRYPELIPEHAEALLNQVPDRALPVLLSNAVGDNRMLNSATDHPLRQINEWVLAAFPGSEDVIRRRDLVATAAIKWLSEGSDQRVGFVALKTSISPEFSDQSQDVADWQRFTIRKGCISIDQLEPVAALWDRFQPTLAQLTISHWRDLLEAVDQWMYPGRIPANLPDGFEARCHSTARRMIQDLATLSAAQPGISAELRQRAELIGLDLEFANDSVFDTLFPRESPMPDWREQQERHAKGVRQLAEKWKDRPAAEWIADLEACVRQARAAGITWPDYTVYLCSLIADRVESILLHADEAMAKGLQSKHVCALLEPAANRGEFGWVDRAVACLKSDRLQDVGVQLLLSVADLHPKVDELLLKCARNFPFVVQSQCTKGVVSAERLRRLLSDESSSLAEAAAIGVWDNEPQNSVPDDLKTIWRSAIINHASNEYDLKRCFDGDQQLAYEWLRDRISRERADYCHDHDVAQHAAALLGRDQRATLLAAAEHVFDVHRIVKAVVGEDIELYRLLLADESRKFVHLAPLRGSPDLTWASLAVVALECGYNTDEIMRTAQTEGGAFSGPISAHHKSQADEWAAIESHEDSRIREIASAGRQMCLEESENAAKREIDDEFAEEFL